MENNYECSVVLGWDKKADGREEETVCGKTPARPNEDCFGLVMCEEHIELFKKEE